MTDVLNRMPWRSVAERDLSQLLTREWLLTNGLGGYASGSISGAATRRYHGLLIAALPDPLGRTVMFNHLVEELRLADGSTVQLGGHELPGGSHSLHGEELLSEFRLEMGLPVWHYEFHDVVLEKRIVLPYRQNLVHISYKIVSAPAPIRLRLRPSFHFRGHEEPVTAPEHRPYTVTACADRFEVHGADVPPLRMRFVAPQAALIQDGGRFDDVYYRIEAERGYESHGQLWSPGYFRTTVGEGESATLIASTEDWECTLALAPDEALAAERQRRQRLLDGAHPAARSEMAAQLVLAADQFIITPSGRVAEAARTRAAGDEVRTVIAGYHWFTDWGRDTMISLEGLTLSTGRHGEAGYILRTFGQYIRDGLIPNLFPEGQHEGLYHTADATMWYFHAVDRYLQATADRGTLRLLLPKLRSIIHHHLRGTHFGIRIDPDDGLFTQGEEGYQLTWMDAKVDGWVVTPRRGKAVELNALWYNALCLLEGWLREEGDTDGAGEMASHAARARESFNRRFWIEDRKYLFDVVDGPAGNDAAMRPNQVFAIALPHPILKRERWESVLEQCVSRLVTPMGLRSLAPGEPDYKPRYDGDLRSRDAAYHQGTVWSWLIGPFIDAWLKCYPNRLDEASAFLEGFQSHLQEACIGSVSEVFDAEAPYTPRGCVAQAWGVAEVLRCLIKIAEAKNK